MQSWCEPVGCCLMPTWINCLLTVERHPKPVLSSTSWRSHHAVSSSKCPRICVATSVVTVSRAAGQKKDDRHFKVCTDLLDKRPVLDASVLNESTLNANGPAVVAVANSASRIAYQARFRAVMHAAAFISHAYKACRREQ